MLGRDTTARYSSAACMCWQPPDQIDRQDAPPDEIASRYRCMLNGLFQSLGLILTQSHACCNLLDNFLGRKPEMTSLQDEILGCLSVRNLLRRLKYAQCAQESWHPLGAPWACKEWVERGLHIFGDCSPFLSMVWVGGHCSAQNLRTYSEVESTS